jgi:PIN domain nuclease of toxin-antitoxin system
VVTAEIAIKHAIGRLKLPATPAELITALLREHGFEPLALEHAHSLELGRLPLHHRDPFDRMLVAQCRIERLHLVSCDRSMGLYDVDILW